MPEISGRLRLPPHASVTTAKFAETVEPLIGCALPVPPAIARVTDRPGRSTRIGPELER